MRYENQVIKEVQECSGGRMTKEEALDKTIAILFYHKCHFCKSEKAVEELGEIMEVLENIAEEMAIKALEQEPRKGEWLRMSNEQEDDRYQCSRCKNVVHYKDKMNLYTFNSWCGRCGSDNGRKIEVKI